LTDSDTQLPDWQNPAVLCKNREEPHSLSPPFLSSQDALDQARSQKKLLNGTWNFRWTNSPSDIPESFHESEFLTDDWNKIPVPSNWQLLGYGVPNYTNARYPFPIYPPFVPDHNEIGLYRHTFVVPSSWVGNEITLHFGGVNSAFYV
jgi:beta-galactosidase